IKIPRSFAEPDPEEAAREKSRAELEAYIAERKKRLAELDQKIAALRAKLDAKRNGKLVARAAAFVGKPHEKILFLPAGRVRSVVPPEQEVTVDDRFAARLNLFVVSVFDQGNTPYLDLAHDFRTKIFEITKFEFEPSAGVVAYGRFTPLGRKLRDQRRISGVSPTIPVSQGDQNPLSLAYGTEPIPVQSETRSVLRTSHRRLKI